MYRRETEIRHILPADIYRLAQILDPNNSWKKLMQVIPKDFDSQAADDRAFKYNYDHVRLVENASMKQNRMATEILLDEWSTSGKRRPTLGVLLELLIKAELFRAADLVALNYLNEAPPARPTKGPAAKIDISIPLTSASIHDIEAMLNEGESNFPGTETLNDNARSNNLADNNIDYYQKYRPNRKDINFPSQSSSDDTPATSSKNVNTLSRPSTYNGAITPKPPTEQLTQSTQSEQQTQIHSDLIKFSSSSIAESQVIPVLSELFPSTGVDLDINNSEVSVSQSMDIPMLSALNTQRSEADMLPNISALHVEDVEIYDEKQKPPEEVAFMLSSSSVSSLSTSPDDDDLSAPNLSILDQRSSNNDSSLTNVTGTSEENSFEISINEGSTSNDNIPCLSALK